MDERTPLIRPGRHVAYVDAGLDGGGEADDERLIEGEFESDDETEPDGALRAAALKREEDAVFGPWPWRLLNRHVSNTRPPSFYDLAHRFVLVVVVARGAYLVWLLC